MTFLPRFVEKIELSNSGCWTWTGAKTRGGYGVFWLDRRQTGAHQAAYTWANGPIPEDMTVDHECHNESNCHEGDRCSHRACVNPAHLRLKTLGENAAEGKRRITHCPQQHPYDAENTYITPKGKRMCRTCMRASYERSRKRAEA